MKKEMILSVADIWNKQTYALLDLREIRVEDLDELLLNTYEVLYEYQHENVIPKEVCRLLLNQDEFMSFLVILGSNQDELKETAKLYQALYCVIDTLKQRFFGGGFELSFPMLQVDFNGSDVTANMEQGILKAMVK